MDLSPNFPRWEFERSDIATRNAIKNTMNAVQLMAARTLAVEVLEPIRAYYGVPVDVSSGFRCLAVNRKLGSDDDSQHTKGEAADITVRGVSVEQLYSDIKAGKIPGLKFDQLIHEVGWVHISYRKGRLRGQRLRARFTKAGKVIYTKD